MKSVENKNFKISVNRCILASCTKIYEISEIGQSYICINSIYLQILPVIDEK